jgi:hypothetical protein
MCRAGNPDEPGIVNRARDARRRLAESGRSEHTDDRAEKQSRFVTHSDSSDSKAIARW